MASSGLNLDDECRQHNKTNGFAVYDCQGIFLFYACEKCEEEKRKGYNPWVFSGYSQADVDEPIEPDDIW